MIQRRVSRPGRRLAVRVACLTLAGAAWAAPPGTHTVEPEEVARQQNEGLPLLLIDVRPAQQFELGHVEGAINIPAFALERRRLPSGSAIVVYDGGDGTGEAVKAYESLAELGCDVRLMAGGLLRWEVLGNPVLRPSGVAPGPLVRLITPEQLRRLLDEGALELSIVDVRPREKFDEGRVPGARSSTPETIARDLGTRSLERVVVICGDGGERDLAAAEALRRAGFRGVRVLYGGFEHWSAKGLEVAR